jgi:hypothetical protein
MNRNPLCWLASLLLTQSATAQLAPIVWPQSSQGMFTGISLGTQLEDSTGTRLRFRTPGTTTGGNVAWDPATFGAPSAQHPDYRNEALFSRWTPYIPNGAGVFPWVAGLPLHNPVLGDMSTGGDLTPPVDANGVMDMVAGSDTAWYSLSFTVAKGTKGVTGSVFSQLPSAAGHVFSYTVPLSTGIRPDLVNTLRFEYTRGQMGLTGTTTEITALDWGMGIISTGATGGPGGLQPIRTRLYFTLDRDWWLSYGSVANGASRTNLQVVILNEPSFELSPSVVYRMDWNGAHWSVPSVAFDQTALYGSAQAVGQSSGPAIDGLSVDQPGTTEGQWRVVFSLDSSSTISGNPPHAEILVSQSSNGATGAVTAKPLSVRQTPNGPGIPVDNVIGIGPDEVTGLCGRDPKENSILDSVVGTPLPVMDEGDEVKTEIGLSLQRFDSFGPNKTSVPTDSMLFEVHGIEIPGDRIGVLMFEGDLAPNGPSMPLTLPIKFYPQLLPGAFILVPETETHSLILPTTPYANHDLRIRALLGLVGPESLDIQQSWVSCFSM